MKLPVAIVLSGCGVNDGTEITEAVGILVALSAANFPYVFYAPDRNQREVVDHVSGQVFHEQRNMLVESARIARGKIHPLAELDVAAYSAVIFPGGFGAAKNLTSFASEGVAAQLDIDVFQVTQAAIAARKPMVALCAAPLVLGLAAQAAGLRNAKMTFGSYAEGRDLIEALVAWGQQHIEMSVDGACVDKTHRFISVPAYMYGNATPVQVFSACQSAVAALQNLLEQE